MYNIELMRPNGKISTLRKYYLTELDQIEAFFYENIDFYKYYRSGSTHLDNEYFLREEQSVNFLMGTFYFEKDPTFSTISDYTVARILANEMLCAYLNDEILQLEEPRLKHPSFPKIKITWTRSKTELVELIYAIYEACCFNFGKGSLKQLIKYFEVIFNIDLGNPYHTYLEIRERSNRTQFLDKLKELLIAKMDNDDCK